MTSEDEFADLAHYLRENMRVREGSVPLYVDLLGNLEKVTRKQHQILFGRRGSGKSCLVLTHHSMAEDRKEHSVYVNADLYKRASYPDILAWLVKTLLSSLIEERGDRRKTLPRLLKELEQLLSEEEERNVVRQVTGGAASSAGAKLTAAGQGIEMSLSDQSSVTTTATYVSRKRDLLERRLPEYSSEVALALKARKADAAYFIVDDLYALAPDVQPDVVDYLHRLLSGTGMYLKVASVRHRTHLSRLDDGVFVGLEIRQDAEEIDLDLTLEDPERTARILMEIADTFAGQVGIPHFCSARIEPVALRLLVTASGGVARDFLELICRSIDELPREFRASQLDVSCAIRGIGTFWASSKLPTFGEEGTQQRSAMIEPLFNEIRRWCIQESGTPLFGILRSDLFGLPELGAAVEDLVDLKLIHVIARRGAILNRTEEVSIFLLDLSAFHALEAFVAGDNSLQLLDNGTAIGDIEMSSVFTLMRAETLVRSLVAAKQEERTDDDSAGSVGDKLATRALSSPEEQVVTKYIYMPTRELLPIRRQGQTTMFEVGGAAGYFVAEIYDDGRLGQLRIAFGKQGSTLAGMMDGFSEMASLCLQYGVPLESMLERFLNTRFEPAGITIDPDIRMAQSVLDYVFRRLALDYLEYEQRVDFGILTAQERISAAEGAVTPSRASDARASLVDETHSKAQEDGDH